MPPRPRNLPLGIEYVHSLYKGKKFTYSFYRASVLVLTFLCYAGFHASRKPPSIVKSVLRGDGSAFKDLTSDLASTAAIIPKRSLFSADIPVAVDVPIGPGWAPFNGLNGQILLGQVDLAFLGAYAIGMFFAGHLGDRLDLRWFLSFGMLGSGIFVILFGMGFFWDTHILPYYVLVSIIAGLFQSTGWPSVVSIMANWFGKGKRGLVMGIWNAHTSVGNICGTFMAAAALSSGWGYSFVWPGVIMVLLSVLVFMFLVVQPADLGMAPVDPSKPEDEEESESRPLKASIHEADGIHFMDAWRIPGVTPYAFCLFFAKLIAYTFLYWLPYYINNTPIQGKLLTPKQAGDLSVLFDVGGVAGGVMAGHLSDKFGASALVATSFTLLSIPVLFLYRTYGYLSLSYNIGLMMLSGFFVNGPYALITTAVSADLGTHESLQGNAKALATVTAIIDGMGSIGAAIGPMLTGYISESGGFDLVFVMLYVSALTAGLLISKIAAKEYLTLKERSTKRPLPA